MSDEGPSDVALLELLDRDLAREGSIRLIEHVLGSDLDALAQMLAHHEQVQCWRRDDDLYSAFSSVCMSGEVCRH